MYGVYYYSSSSGVALSTTAALSSEPADVVEVIRGSREVDAHFTV